MSPEARVGLVAVLAFLVALGFALWLPRAGLLRPQGYAIVLEVRDAAGLAEGTPVRLSGVTVGRVSAIRLSEANEALVTLKIKPGVQISQGSTFQVATTGLVGEQHVAITPGPPGPPIPPDAKVRGQDAFSLERTARKLEQVADRVEVLVENANTLIADPQMRADLREALHGAREATAIARDVLIQARAASASVQRTASTVEGAAERVRAFLDADLVAVAADLRAMAENLVDTSERVQAFVESTTADGTVARDLRETAASLRDAGGRIRQMAEDLQGLINPDNVQKARETVEDARATVKHARGVVQQAGSLLDRVNGLVPQGLRIPGRQDLFTLTYEGWHDGRRAGHSLDLTLLPAAGRSYRLGIHDIGGSNGAVLQVGTRLNSTLWWRAGIYESQVGLGLDYRPAGPLSLSLDVYNLNLITADARLRYQLTPRWGLTFGGRNLLHDPVPVFGLGTTF